MKTEIIHIKVIDPYNKKINVVQRIPKDSKSPVSTAFYHYIANKEASYEHRLCGEGAWEL